MRQRVSLQSLVTLSVLAVGMVSGTVGLAYAYWHARQSLQTTVGITFEEIARQSADKAALLLAREIEWVQRLAALPDLQASMGSAVLSAQTARQIERWREAQPSYFIPWRLCGRIGNWWAGPLTGDGEGHRGWEVAASIGARAGAGPRSPHGRHWDGSHSVIHSGEPTWSNRPHDAAG